jgi:hypothetical protein
MKPLWKLIKYVLICVGVLFLLLLLSFIPDFFLMRRATPPNRVTDLKTFFEWKPNPSGAEKVTVSNTVYYQLLGPAGRSLASGRAAYAFDANGKFIGWTKDAGDFYEPKSVYAPDAKREQISIEEVRALLRTNALAPDHL